MINPYGLPPGHRINPVEPVIVGETVHCGCDACCQVREEWTNRQPPLIEDEQEDE